MTQTTPPDISFVHSHRRCFTVALVCSLVGYFPLMGMPGAALTYGLDHTIVPLVISNPSSLEAGYGDAAENIAIGYSVFLPWLVLALYLSLQRILRHATYWRLFAAAAVGAFCITVIFHLVFCYPITVLRANENIAFQMQQDLPENTRDDLVRLIEPLTESSVKASTFLQKMSEDPEYLATYTVDFKRLADKIVHDPTFYGVGVPYARTLTEMETLLSAQASSPSPSGASLFKASPDWQKLRHDAQTITKLSGTVAH